MKKVFFLASALVVLAACSNDDELPAPSPEREPISIDLKSMNYESIMTLLSKQTSLKDVTFTDGATIRNISELVASTNLDPRQAGVLIFNSANTEDSLDLTISPEYVAVRMNVEGKQMAYMAFADQSQQNEITGLYEETIPATRSDKSVVTRSASGESFCLDLTTVREQMKAKYVAEGTYALPERELKYQTLAVTRSFISDMFQAIIAALYKDALTQAFAPTPTIDVYLLREKGANPVYHEMNWQVNDAINSLKNIQNKVNFNVHIENCNFSGTYDSNYDIDCFRTWIKKSKYANTNGIFILCRWGGWDNVLGRGELDSYNVNDDLKAYAISATNAWNKFTMAHEMGHIFGAQHVQTEWWQLFRGVDLMSATSYDWLSSGQHKDKNNRERIKENMTVKL